MVAAALLHDVVEDTELTLDILAEHFAFEFTDLVDWLTHVSALEDGNRETRMQIECNRVARAPAMAQTIKVCDLAHNSESILLYGGGFAKVYIPEKVDLLRMLNKCEPIVYKEAGDLVRHAVRKLMLRELCANENGSASDLRQCPQLYDNAPVEPYGLEESNTTQFGRFNVG